MKSNFFDSGLLGFKVGVVVVVVTTTRGCITHFFGFSKTLHFKIGCCWLYYIFFATKTKNQQQHRKRRWSFRKKRKKNPLLYTPRTKHTSDTFYDCVQNNNNNNFFFLIRKKKYTRLKNEELEKRYISTWCNQRLNNIQ
jgi:hypothetical protein